MPKQPSADTRKARRRGRPALRLANPGLTPDMLNLVAQLEGKPFPSGRALSVQLGVSQAIAFRIRAEIRERGIVRLVDLMTPPMQVCRSVVYLRMTSLQSEAMDALDHQLQSDVAVQTAVWISGPYDCRLTTIHADEITANAWFQRLLKDPAIIDGSLQFTQPIFDRHHYAAAILGSARTAATPAGSVGSASPP